MTGLYPHTTGCTANNLPLRRETRTIAELVSGEVLCAYYGKWHLGDEVVPQHGFEKWLSIEDYYRRYYSKPEYLSYFSDYHHFLARHGFVPDVAPPEWEIGGAATFDRYMAASVPERFTKASFLGERAASFIRENCDRWFMLYVNFLEPHNPFTGPYNGLYAREELCTDQAFGSSPPENVARINRLMADWYAQVPVEGHDLSTETELRDLRAKYLGNVTLVDRAVGSILRALDETGLVDSTMVVFTSDHGDMMGDHGIIEKCVLYEEAVKVPLILRVPWLAGSQTMVEGRVSQVDLVPTLLDLMGDPVPEGLQGRTLAPVLRGEETLSGSDVFIQWNGSNARPPRSLPRPPIPDEAWAAVAGPWRTVISGDGWKLNLSGSDQCELYDLNNDPCELQNLFDVPAQRKRVRELTDRILAWQRRTGDGVQIPGC
jgi:arylsulfatase A-like enzyme